MGGGGGGTNTVTETADPWSGQQSYLQDIFKRAQEQFYSGGPQQYPGKTVAGFAPQQLQAQQYTADYARTAQPFINRYQQGSLYGMEDALDVGSNPYVQGMADAATAPVEDWLNDRLRQERGEAIQAGNFNSSVRGNREGRAMADAAKAMVDARAKVFGQAYGQGLGAYGASLAAGPQALEMGQVPGRALAGVGAERQVLSQAKIDDARRRWEYEQNRPEAALGQYSRMVQGQYGGTNATTTDGGGSSLGAGMLGGGLLGYGALQAMAPAGTFGTGTAAVAGTTPWGGWALPAFVGGGMLAGGLLR